MYDGLNVKWSGSGRGFVYGQFYLSNLLTLCANISCKSLLSQTDKRTGKPKVWIYKDKNSGVPKGEATITFDDPETAKAAIDWFDGEAAPDHMAFTFSGMGKFPRIRYFQRQSDCISEGWGGDSEEEKKIRFSFSKLLISELI